MGRRRGDLGRWRSRQRAPGWACRGRARERSSERREERTSRSGPTGSGYLICRTQAPGAQACKDFLLFQRLSEEKGQGGGLGPGAL